MAKNTKKIKDVNHVIKKIQISIGWRFLFYNYKLHDQLKEPQMKGIKEKKEAMKYN